MKMSSLPGVNTINSLSLPSIWVTVFQESGRLLNEAIPGLLLIDPPYVDPEDANAAEKLFDMARELDWTVLCWYMIDREILPKDRIHEFSIQFSQIGLDYCGAKGCTVKVACSNRTLLAPHGRKDQGVPEDSSKSRRF